ncbi:MAG TPA: response regulator transcription factor [Clostridia bacterium]|nr:response regulator transcription factor [Clostridia bacterium]
MTKILFVEDDKTIAMGVEYSLRQEGFEVTLAFRFEEALKQLGNPYDLILLDLGLPDGNGYEICRLAHADGTPVVILTARDEEVSVVQGLDMGADDYITKPFRLRELISRLRAVLRRRQPDGAPGRNLLRCGGIAVDTQTMKVTKDYRDIPLTALEYRLLLILLTNKGRVLTRERLLECIWDVAGDFVNDNTLTVYIKRLREKLEDDPQNPSVIKTVRGVGYVAGE